ncbi:MAG: hypothetical protein SVY10_11765 [Thermodesulfobacteriota bacterium]|nr:hypothetical protein [Thermodesulfobacteriota bacterium]
MECSKGIFDKLGFRFKEHIKSEVRPMKSEKGGVEDSAKGKALSTFFDEHKINEMDWDWNDYLESVLYYGLESWGGG